MGVHTEKAKLLIERKRYKDALQEIGEILKEDPNDAEGYLLLGQCLHCQGKVGESLEAIQKAIALEPESSYAHYFLGWFFFDRSLKEKIHQTELLSLAQGEVERALRLTPEHPGYFSLLAHIQFNQQRIKKALTTAEKGLSLEANHQGCLHIRSLALSELQEGDRAKETIDRSLEINPEEHNAFTVRGWIHWNKSQYRQARESFQEALRLDAMDEWGQRGLRMATLACNPITGLAYTYRRLYPRWILRVLGTTALFLGGAWFFSKPWLEVPAVWFAFLCFFMVLFLNIVRLYLFSVENTAVLKESLAYGASRKRLGLQVGAGLSLGVVLVGTDVFFDKSGMPFLFSDDFFFQLFVPSAILFFLFLVLRKPKGVPVTRRDKIARVGVAVGCFLTGVGWGLTKSPWTSWSDPVETAGVVTLLMAILYAVVSKKWAGRGSK